jgi:transcriptional regulator with XRE-family HTH domain
MGFRENLKQELAFKGMLIKELAALSGVHKRAIDTYVRTPSSMPPADAAVKIARALGVTVEYLVSGEETAVPRDAREIFQGLLRLDKRDRRLAGLLIRAMGKEDEDL